MNDLSKGKVILYLAVIFVAGAITGTVIALGNAKRKMLQVPSMEKVCTYMEDKMTDRLGLTPPQLERIRPIWNRAAREMQTLHERTLEEIDATIRRANEEIAKELTEEQRKKLEEMENERREFMQKRFHRSAPGDVPKRAD